jgi:hypothetical protein
VTPPARRFPPGEAILLREVLPAGRPWLVIPVRVVRDGPELLALYLAEGTPFGLPDGPWPTADGRHPWAAAGSWRGHGVLQLQRPGELHTVWVFWEGPDRRFASWYVNIQEPFRRTERGFDTQDLELDLIVAADRRRCEWKDLELIEERVRSGQIAAGRADAARAEAARVAAMVADGATWWDDAWASWRPDPAWLVPPLPAGWDAPVTRDG